MKEILHITSEVPGDNSGGRIVVKQSIVALSKKNNVDYLGPEIEHEKAKNIGIKNIYTLKEEKSKIKRLINLFGLNLSSYYNSFKKLSKEIDWDKYDYIYLEFSKWFFITKHAQKKNKKVIVRLHNIEKDYSYNLYRLNKNLVSYLEYLYYSLTEKRVMKNADQIIVLTEKDKKRLKELYSNELKNKEIIVMPVCIQQKDINKKYLEKNTLTFLITGSLWFGPNLDGIIWFLKNVWEEVNENSKLLIVGSRPSEELKEIIKSMKNIELVENPIDTKLYFMRADIYISPIFTGAGMKVKNAEAMSYGLPIVGSEHSFIGYESSVDLHFIANDKKAFINNINHIKYLNNDEFSKVKDTIVNDFSEKYDINKAYDYLRKFI